MAQGVIIGASNRSMPGFNNTLLFAPALIATEEGLGSGGRGRGRGDREGRGVSLAGTAAPPLRGGAVPSLRAGAGPGRRKRVHDARRLGLCGNPPAGRRGARGSSPRGCGARAHPSKSRPRRAERPAEPVHPRTMGGPPGAKRSHASRIRTPASCLIQSARGIRPCACPVRPAPVGGGLWPGGRARGAAGAIFPPPG
jgi:hypothetical protein